VFALNRFAHGPELFGKDLVSTYGPPGYLAVPQHLAPNLGIAVAVHVAVWCLFLYLLLLLWESGSKAGSLFFVVGLICSNRLHFYYWDYLLSAMAILALLLLLKRPESVSLLVIFAALAGLSFLVKFTGFMLAMLLLTIYAASLLVQWRTVAAPKRVLWV